MKEVIETIEREIREQDKRLGLTAYELLKLRELSENDPLTALQIAYSYGFARCKRAERNRRKNSRSKQ